MNYTIHIALRSPAKFKEVLADDVESTELALESGMYEQLVELFGEGVIVDYVVIRQSQVPGKAHEGLTFQA